VQWSAPRCGCGCYALVSLTVGLKHLLLHFAVARSGYAARRLNVRGHDGLCAIPKRCSRRVLAQAHPGAIVLLHEGRPRSIECILHVTDELLRRGYTFVIPSDEQLV